MQGLHFRRLSGQILDRFYFVHFKIMLGILYESQTRVGHSDPIHIQSSWNSSELKSPFCNSVYCPGANKTEKFLLLLPSPVPRGKYAV